MNKIILGIVVIVILGGGAWYFTSQTPTTTYTNEPPQTTKQDVNRTSTFTVADVATHNSRTSCYTIIRGNIYDVTLFIDKHPGGSEAVLKTCGTDGTELFVAKHGGKEKMEQTLETMKVGTLATQ